MKIPEGWNQVELQEIMDKNHPYPIGDGDHGKILPSMYQKNGIPFIRVRDMVDDEISFKNMVYLSKEVHKKNIGNELVADDLIISKTGSIGKVAIVPKTIKRANTTSSVGKITLDKEVTLPKYVLYFMKTHYFTEQILTVSKKTIMSGFNIKDLKKFKILLPSLSKQKQIVAKLEKFEKIKQMRNESDELTKRYLESVFLEMFGDPINNPKRWKVEKLKNYIDLLTGYPFKSKEYTDDKKEVRLCGGLIIMPYGIEWNKANYWKRNSTDGLDRFWLDVGDIVIAMDRPWISSGFKICQIKDDDVPSLLVQRTARVRGKNINQNFLFWLFKHKSFEINAKPTETTVPHISPKDIQEFEIILPPIELQNEFSKIVKYIEFVKKYQGQSKMNIDNLFKNLTQKIFRGELEC